MSKELQWVREHAKVVATETFTISPEEATQYDECEPGTYKSVTVAFEKYLPYHMVQKLKKAPLVNNAMQSEVLRLGTGYRGGECYCRYGRTTYEKVA